MITTPLPTDRAPGDAGPAADHNALAAAVNGVAFGAYVNIEGKLQADWEVSGGFARAFRQGPILVYELSIRRKDSASEFSGTTIRVLEGMPSGFYPRAANSPYGAFRLTGGQQFLLMRSSSNIDVMAVGGGTFTVPAGASLVGTVFMFQDAAVGALPGPSI